MDDFLPPVLPPSPEYYPGFERELRSNAIYFYNRSVGLLKTDQIISHVIQTVNTRDLNFEHLEWIDDFSCVLAFADQSAAIGALTTLLLNPDEIEGENGLAEAIDYLSSTAPVPPSGDVLAAAAEFVFTLRPSKPLASTLFDNGQPNALLHPTRPEMLVPFVRFASTFDVKRRNAKDHSLFYTLNGQRAGRDRVQAGHAPSLPRSSKRRRNMDSAGGSVDQSHRWSHAEHDEEPSLHSRLMARLPASRRGDGPDRRRAVAMAADLDDELDRFMSRGSTSGIAGEELGRPAEDGSEDEYAPEYRPMKRHEPEEVEQFAKEDLFPRSRLGVGGGNLDLFPLESHEIKQPQSPSEDPLRTWIVQSDARDEGHEEEELGPDEELVDEYVEMIDEETGKKIKRLTQSRRRKNRGLSYGRLI